MRKTLTALLISFMGITGVFSAPFNLQTFEGDVPAGCSIDTIDGIPYLKVRINSWNTFFDIVPITIGQYTSVKFSYKFDKDTSTNTVPVQAFFQLINSDWSVKSSVTDKPASTTIKSLTPSFKLGTYSKLQLAVQQTAGSWSAISGPFIYISKVKVTNSFDIRTFEGDAPEGTSIVTIGGKKYLQVVLNGWNSTFMVRPFIIRDGYEATVEFKYSRGPVTDDTLSISKINAVVQLMDTVNKVKNPWGEGMIPSSTALSQSPASESFKTVSAKLSSSMKLVNQIQFFGQQTLSWGPTTGDTIWVSMVSFKSNNPIVLDPEQVDIELPSWMKVVSIDGKKYFQVILNGWNSTINIVPVPLKEGFSAQVEFKYARCQATKDTLQISKINAVVQVMDTVDKVDNPWGEGLIPSSTALAQSPASETFKTVVGKLSKDMTLINQVQFFGQQTISWGPTTGDTLWFGKIVLVDQTKPTAPANLNATVTGNEVALTWSASTDNDAIAGYIVKQGENVLDTVTKTSYKVSGLADGTYTFSVIAMDKSGNLSAEAKIDGVVVGTAIEQTNITTLSFYPNPVTDVLNIKAKDVIKSIAIYSVTGQLQRIMSINANSTTINLESFNNGIYFISVQTVSGVSTHRIIKK
ncbi:MAG: T9SS type A sorting domain-containing protein [Bacteroidales bacterium]|nr:T9SS type A sorting domain-containing protein [Bacteroidales bacterium]